MRFRVKDADLAKRAPVPSDDDVVAAAEFLELPLTAETGDQQAIWNAAQILAYVRGRHGR